MAKASASYKYRTLLGTQVRNSPLCFSSFVLRFSVLEKTFFLVGSIFFVIFFTYEKHEVKIGPPALAHVTEKENRQLKKRKLLHAFSSAAHALSSHAHIHLPRACWSPSFTTQFGLPSAIVPPAPPPSRPPSPPAVGPLKNVPINSRPLAFSYISCFSHFRPRPQHEPWRGLRRTAAPEAGGAPCGLAASCPLWISATTIDEASLGPF